MPFLPAYCESCGKISCSSVFIKDATYHIKDYEEEDLCPCGGKVRLLDGTYTHLGGPINFCNAPEESHTRFKSMIREVENQEL